MADNKTDRPGSAPQRRPAAGQKRRPSAKAAALAKKRRAQKKRRRLIAALALLLLAAGVFLLVNVLKDDYKLENEDDPVATITLAGGEKLIVELFPKNAPETVDNFARLANAGYYDGLSFHKVVRGERIQAGKGADTSMIRGEFSLNGVDNPLSHTRGTLSMARLTGYDTAASQFFICLGNQSYFDGAYAAFGRVVKGMEYADRIAGAALDESGKPLSDQTIKTIRVDLKEYAANAGA